MNELYVGLNVCSKHQLRSLDCSCCQQPILTEDFAFLRKVKKKSTPQQWHAMTCPVCQAMKRPHHLERR